MQTHLSEDDLVLHYYGEQTAADEARAATHLATCSECHATFRRLQRVLAVVDETAVAGPELPDGFERTVWARLEPDLRRQRTGWFSWFVFSPARLALVASMALLVVAAFVAGRMMPHESGERAAAAANGAGELRERILLTDLDDHFARSQMVLVELINATGSNAWSSERDRAEQLVSANRLYRHTASATGDAAVTQLLEELERVLVEVVAAPEDLSDRGLERMRRRIDEQDLLFKLRVVSSELRERHKRAAHREEAGRSSL